MRHSDRITAQSAQQLKRAFVGIYLAVFTFPDIPHTTLLFRLLVYTNPTQDILDFLRWVGNGK